MEVENSEEDKKEKIADRGGEKEVKRREKTRKWKEERGDMKQAEEKKEKKEMRKKTKVMDGGYVRIVTKTLQTIKGTADHSDF